MQPPTPYVHITIIIRRCPGKKRLGGFIYIPVRHDACAIPFVFSLAQPFHPNFWREPQKDDQLKQRNGHISPPAQRPRQDPSGMGSQGVHQEVLTGCAFLLLGKWRIGWEPEVVVRIEMG
jgi:hypothetical protein